MTTKRQEMIKSYNTTREMTKKLKTTEEIICLDLRTYIIALGLKLEIRSQDLNVKLATVTKGFE